MRRWKVYSVDLMRGIKVEYSGKKAEFRSGVKWKTGRRPYRSSGFRFRLLQKWGRPNSKLIPHERLGVGVRS